MTEAVTGIREQRIDVTIADRLDDHCNAFDGREVGLHRLDVHAAASKVFRRLFDLRLVRRDHEVVPVPGAQPRELEADAGRGTGDDRKSWWLLHGKPVGDRLGTNASMIATNRSGAHRARAECGVGRFPARRLTRRSQASAPACGSRRTIRSCGERPGCRARRPLANRGNALRRGSPRCISRPRRNARRAAEARPS